MQIETINSRHTLTFTRAEALKQIKMLASAIEQSEKSGCGWWSDGIIKVQGENNSPARITFRVEG